LPISSFDPVLVEVSLGFVAGRPRLGSLGLGPAMDKAIGSGGLLGFAAFLPLASVSQINNVAHQELNGNRVWIEAIQAPRRLVG
jgi:hypothetical protein